MSINLVQASVTNSGGTPYVGLSLGSAVTAHSALLAIGTLYSTADGTTQAVISDSVNGAWPAAVMGAVYNTEVAFAAILPDTAAGSPVLTVSLTGAGSGARVQLYELSGVLTASAMGVSNPGAGTGSAPSISLPGVSAGSALFACIAGSSAPTTDPAWALGMATASANFESVQYLLDAGAAGTKVAAWTPSMNWGGLVIEVKADGGGGPSIMLMGQACL